MSNHLLDTEKILIDKGYFLSIQAKLKSGQLDPTLATEEECLAYADADIKFRDYNIRDHVDASFKGENYYIPEPSPQRLFWNILGRRLGF